MNSQKPTFENKGKHTGHSKHALYSTWGNMLRRCYCVTDRAYGYYGAQGIDVAPEWFIFENFMHDIGDKPSKTHSLDRINNNLGYSKSNCRWATKSEQCANRRIFKNNTIKKKTIVLVHGYA